jgi:hypothetical protein
MYTQVREEESSPLLCGFTATLFGLMPLVYEDSVKVKIGLGRNNTLPNFLSCYVLLGPLFQHQPLGSASMYGPYKTS